VSALVNDKYDAVIVSCPEYKQETKPPQRVFMPAIDPFTIKNRHLSEKEIDEQLAHYKIPTDSPLVAQISRFYPWKDPEGVVEAFKLASKEADARLVLLGNFATDDPEGEEIFNSLCACRDERILILIAGDDTALVNALQTRATVVLQKSLREGFGLTVSEAMWKSTPAIGGNVGGIRYQIEDGVNGFPVSSIEEAAERIVRLLKDEKLHKRDARRARPCVRNFWLRATSNNISISSEPSIKTLVCESKRASATDFWQSRSRRRQCALPSRLLAAI
jgi:trehalose synthase